MKAQRLAFIQQHFGKAGPYYYWFARGVDERPVRADRIRKSIGAENTFFADIFTFDAAREAMEPILRKSGDCEATRLRGRTVTLKVKYADFQQITRGHTGVSHIATQAELERLGLALLGPDFPAPKGNQAALASRCRRLTRNG